MYHTEIISVSLSLDRAGLVWHPEIGDEVSERESLDRVSILVDPQGLTPRELRENFVWLPSVEQLVAQFEARQAVIYHAGLTTQMHYEAVVKTAGGVIESNAATLRLAFGKALEELLVQKGLNALH